MRYFLISVKDTATQAYSQPQYYPAQQAAIRSIRDAVNVDPSNPNPLSQHPEDYEVYQVGMFDDNTGGLIPDESPVLIARCKDLVKVKQ